MGSFGSTACMRVCVLCRRDVQGALGLRAYHYCTQTLAVFKGRFGSSLC